MEREKETTLGWSLIIPTHPFQGETDQILIDAQHDALFFHIPKKGKMEFQAQIMLYQAKELDGRNDRNIVLWVCLNIAVYWGSFLNFSLQHIVCIYIYMYVCMYVMYVCM